MEYGHQIFPNLIRVLVTIEHGLQHFVGAGIK